MRKTKQISVNLMVTVASFFLGACGPSEESATANTEQWQWQQCVDENGNIVPDEKCEEAQRQQHAGGYFPYHWWFFYGGMPLGMGSNIKSASPGTAYRAPFTGVPVSRAASYTPTHPAHPAARSTTRGIFGGTGSTRSAIG